jgi:hypothetical protein
MHKADRLAEGGQGTMSDKSCALRAKSDEDRDRQTVSPLGRGGEFAGPSLLLGHDATASLSRRVSAALFGTRDFIHRTSEAAH